ncbi:hypothetical protein O9H85_01885 [Paenibacillus filicis]|uniref:Lipoprotein n=1 Tax=Paenibacillus gyeongsangnamensis TaxID=3388067 RepID=A0ABT4Q2V6_9BACL|nr:hypothetical protein [Paenibacillus filicis]MCZ8511208.1 hypothetical protein [Paenibacillus filicis]
MLTPKNIAIPLLLGCAVLLTAGCTDHQQLKQQVVQAAKKQEEIRSYQFTGSVNLKLDAALFQGLPPMTAAMLSLLKESTIEYTGAASSADVLQTEADLKITPKGAAAPIPMPVLIKDNKLYLQLPAVNKPDEYTSIPLDKGAASADKLKNAGHLNSVLSGKLLEGVDPAWIGTDNKTEKLADGSTVKHLTIDVTSKNEKAAADYLAGSLPALLGELVSNGLSSQGQTDAWKKTAESIRLTAPSSITLAVDEQGYIRRQSGQLHFTLGTAKDNAIEWTQELNGINQKVTFAKETPKQVKTLDDILRLLPKPQPQK